LIQVKASPTYRCSDIFIIGPFALERIMKALVYRGPGLKSLEDRPKPEIEAPGDAIVKILMTTICGTDLHILKEEIEARRKAFLLKHRAVTDSLEEPGEQLLPSRGCRRAAVGSLDQTVCSQLREKNT
jgi:threonine dehydrogenase-like Zn-dependent dehydrogenase